MGSLKITNGEDKKTLLLAKMTEEGWRVPVVMNQACKLAVVDATKKKDKKRVDQTETDSVVMEQEAERTFSMPMSHTAFER